MTAKLSNKRKELVDAAYKAREFAYAPYSKFKVGAAVRTESGQIYAGCNIENASYGLSICAERTAIFMAISAGHKSISQLAVCTNAVTPSTPCGACRQVLFEFGKHAEVLMSNLEGDVRVSTITELFPQPFTLP